MGILNVTPDSFSDGGTLYTDQLDLDKTLFKSQDMIAAGAGIIDVGGESTRPGASEVGVGEELARSQREEGALRRLQPVPLW